MSAEELRDLAVNALEDLKAVDIVVMDVREKTSMADFIIVASGTSSRHVKSIADNVVMEAKHSGHQPLGVEGEEDAEWVLVDLGDVIVHVMQPQIREFYDIEGLWKVTARDKQKMDVAD